MHRVDAHAVRGYDNGSHATAWQQVVPATPRTSGDLAEHRQRVIDVTNVTELTVEVTDGSDAVVLIVHVIADDTFPPHMIMATYNDGEIDVRVNRRPEAQALAMLRQDIGTAVAEGLDSLEASE
jgi:hypothetical protein